MVDAVLFEWEGVVVDTLDSRRDALLGAFGAEGIDVDARAYDASRAGQSPREEAHALLARLGRDDPALADLLALRASRAFLDRMGQGFVLRRAAREFVERVCASTRVAIVTAASHEETSAALRMAELESSISTVVSVDDVLGAPPQPDVFDRAVEQLSRIRGVQRNRVVALGRDARTLRAARAAGLRTIALATPAHIALEGDGAIESLSDISIADLARLSGIAAMERHS